MPLRATSGQSCQHICPHIEGAGTTNAPPHPHTQCTPTATYYSMTTSATHTPCCLKLPVPAPRTICSSPRLLDERPQWHVPAGRHHARLLPAQPQQHPLGTTLLVRALEAPVLIVEMLRQESVSAGVHVGLRVWGVCSVKVCLAHLHSVCAS